MLKLGRKILSFRKRIVAIVVGVTMVTLSLLFTNDMARRLREKEQHEVALWVHAMERVMSDSSNDPFVQDILSQRNNIPFIITNQNLKVLHSHLIPEEIINHPDRLRKKINQLTEENTPITIQYYWGKDHKHIIFFGQSRLLKTLYWFPYIQLSVIAIFILLGFIAFRSTKQDEQNRVWIGLAKETAHQLGTPTSSLLGWIEYLRTQPVDQGAVEEMNKDLSHLMKIVDRFSKIGSETPLTPENINEVVSGSVMYFRTRAPRNVTIDYNGLAIAPVKAQINAALFEWVVENLIKIRSTPSRGTDGSMWRSPRTKIRDDRHQGYRQGDSQKQLETNLRTGFHDQNPGMGPRTLPFPPRDRRVSPGPDRRRLLRTGQRHRYPHYP